MVPADVYVLASGPTVTYIEPGFFDGKTVIAVNSAAERMGIYDTATVYTVSHYHFELLSLARKYPRSHFYAPEGDGGHAGQPSELRHNVTYYPHPPTRYEFSVEDAVHPDGLIVGSTSLHGAMHLACRIGARNVILVGADCGLLDGETNEAGYKSGNLEHGDVLDWLARWDQHLQEVKAWLVGEYGVRIYSLLPFVNANLEGHRWEGSRGMGSV